MRISWMMRGNMNIVHKEINRTQHQRQTREYIQTNNHKNNYLNQSKYQADKS